MKKAACIFDLDGTLADTLQDIGNALNQALERKELPPHPLSSIRQFIGHGVHALVLRALPDTHAENPEDILQSFREIYGEHLLDTTLPYPGIPSLLEELASEGIPMGILSNKPHAMTREIAWRLFPGIPFVDVVGQQEDVPSKPDPTSALILAAQMGVSPEQCVLMGDTPVDIQTALSAGMMHVGVTWGFRTEDDLLKAGATHIAKDAHVLRSFLI